MAALLDELVALVVPPRCCACGAPAPGTRAAGPLCGACRRALPWLREPLCPRCALPLPHARRGCPASTAPFDTAWAAVAYEGCAREVLHALKFSAARPLAGLMAAQIAAGAAPLLQAGATVVPVPAHPLRRRARGFDPAELVARDLARRTGAPLDHALRRGRAASRQLGASRQARRDPAQLHFRAAFPGRAPARVVLVDDVHTTGATLGACAQALRDAGTTQITAITWARTLDDRPVEPDLPQA